MYCTECGTQLAGRFCWRCGAQAFAGEESAGPATSTMAAYPQPAEWQRIAGRPLGRSSLSPLLARLAAVSQPDSRVVLAVVASLALAFVALAVPALGLVIALVGFVGLALAMRRDDPNATPEIATESESPGAAG